MNIYVGNLPYSAGDTDLREAFERFGPVESVNIIMDRETNRSRGYGFVVMNSDTEANAAIEGLNGQDLQGRQLRVNEARPRTDRTDRRSGPRRTSPRGP
jgi:RNA recognition motif-containing protein